jgi:hypothetical protein
MNLAAMFPALSGGLPTANPLEDESQIGPSVPMGGASPTFPGAGGMGGGLPLMPGRPGLPGGPAGLMSPQPMAPQGGGLGGVLSEIAPLLLAAFSVKSNNPLGSAALMHGVLQGKQQKALEAAKRETDAQKRRDAATEFMMQAAHDAQSFDTPEDAAAYLAHAEQVLHRIDPTIGPGALSRAVPLNTAAMQKKTATATQKAAADRIAQLRTIYGDNFDQTADSASVTFQGKTIKVRDLLGLAEVNLSTDAGPVSSKAKAPATESERLTRLLTDAQAAEASGDRLKASTLMGQYNAALKQQRDFTTPPRPAATSDYGDFLARWAKDHGKTVDTITAADELQAKKAYGQADDRPVDPTLATLRQIQIDNARDKAANKPALSPQAAAVARGFDSLPAVRSVQKMAEAVQFAGSMDPNTKNPADDQALIYAFAKAMDPDSVVREGEYATVQKYAQSWAQTFGFNTARMFSNTAFLTPEARANMKKTIAAKFSTAAGQYNNLRRSYGERINRMTGRTDGADYLTDYDGGTFPGSTAPAPSTPAATAPAASPGGSKPATLRYNPATGKADRVK